MRKHRFMAVTTAGVLACELVVYPGKPAVPPHVHVSVTSECRATTISAPVSGGPGILPLTVSVEDQLPPMLDGVAVVLSE